MEQLCNKTLNLDGEMVEEILGKQNLRLFESEMIMIIMAVEVFKRRILSGTIKSQVRSKID